MCWEESDGEESDDWGVRNNHEPYYKIHRRGLVQIMGGGLRLLCPPTYHARQDPCQLLA